MKVTATTLVDLMRQGAKLRPVSWGKAALLQDGYCYIRNLHTFVQHTPSTVGVAVSPAIVGANEAIDQFGDNWEAVS